jgi:hypothetical protein
MHTKNLKKIAAGNILHIFFDQKLKFGLSLGLLKGLPIYSTVQEKPSTLKREHQAFQNMKILYIFYFCG